MAAVAVLSSNHNWWAETLFNALKRSGKQEYTFLSPSEFCNIARESIIERVCVYAPPFADHNGATPDLIQSESVLRQISQLPKARLVLISSALIYGIGPARQPFAGEESSPRRKGSKRICDQWIRLEELAQSCLSEHVRFTTLRPVSVLPSPTLFSERLLSPFVATLPGHDPVFQVLSLEDLVDAIVKSIDLNKSGTFNLAPDGVISLNAAIRLTGNHLLPIPRTLQRFAGSSELLDYFRYPWTVSNARAKKELGLHPMSSVAVLKSLRRSNGYCPGPEVKFDDFGMDKRYIQFYGKTLFRFLSDFYWRIEVRGLQHVPPTGRAVLVGMHRGFMPWDGVMALHLLVQKTGRYPRFLTHPGLLKFPFLANFMTKLGGIVACQESADRILATNEMLAIFPEGIHGAFTSYRRAYQLQDFGRDAFVKIALRNRAPIVPFVTVGSAEIFPILGKIRSKRWTKYTDWPCLPLTPTFPLLPVPLPSKWHTQFLAPLHIEEEYPPEAERNTSVVKSISLEVRTRMQRAIDQMLVRRRSIFFRSIFQPEADS